jgi:hypothetical protein
MTERRFTLSWTVEGQDSLRLVRLVRHGLHAAIDRSERVQDR